MDHPVRRAFHFAVRCLVLGCLLLCGTGTTRGFDPPPELEVTTTPASDLAGPVVTIRGKVGFTYTAFPDVADNTTFDLTDAVWTSRDDHPTETMFVAGNQPVPPRSLRIVGGVLHGSIPAEWSWTLTHSFGGSGFLTIATGLQTLEGARIHNVQDGWRPRETPEFLPRAYPNTGRFLMRGCYLSAIRDDCIENDEFLPGSVEDSLFDGVFTFLSEQNEKLNGVRYLEVPTIGPGEDPTVTLKGVLVRLAVNSGGEVGPGTWFKLHGYDSPNHQLVIEDSVFAVGTMPRTGWKHLNFPKGTTFQGTNHFLWLGEPGTCGATIAEGLTFLEGQAARDKWVELRNNWLIAHGYESRPSEEGHPLSIPVAAPAR